MERNPTSGEIMPGLIFGFLLLIIGVSIGLRQARRHEPMSDDWRANQLPEHEAEARKRS